MIVTNDQKFSSNINEVIWALIFFFIIRFHEHKATYSEQKWKNTHKKHLREKKLLIPLLAFCAFSAFSKNKEFKRSQENSFYVFTSPTKLEFICMVLV